VSALISRAVLVQQTPQDAAELIYSEVAGLIDNLHVGGADVLVAVFTRIGRSKGGVLLSDRTTDEDNYQGVSAMVLKLGPYAYQSDKTKRWFVDKDGEPRPPRPGDWVLFDTKNNFPFKLGARTCRLINDQYVMAIIDRPDMVA